MNAIATIALPFFALILLGYGARRLGWLKQGVAGLEFFVTWLALPVFYFQLVARTAPADLADWSFLITTAFAAYCAFAIAFSVAALINHGSVPEATISGLIGSEANIAVMGPAITIAAFGPAAGAPTALVFACLHVMFAALVPLMMALGGTERTNPRALATTIALDAFVHPLVLATIAGLIASLVHLRLPGPVETLLTALRVAAVPCALFLLGARLPASVQGPVDLGLLLPIAFKLVVHPLIVYLLITWIGGFSRLWLGTAVLLAALPPAAEVAGFARRYEADVKRSSDAFLIGTTASVISLIVVLVLMIGDLLPGDPFR